jgi:transposase
VTTVAMQSTGVYWIPVYEILDARGFEVYLVDARHTKNLSGRKTDVQESLWLLKLPTYGLLRNSFHPPAETGCERALPPSRRSATTTNGGSTSNVD